MSRTLPNSAFFTKMQQDGLLAALVIDLETRGQNYHWTSANNELFVTLSGTLTKYDPFPGQTLNGLKQTNDLGVSIIDFIVANTGDLISDLLSTNDLDFATLKLGRIFTDTPDLGRMDIFEGRIGDYVHDRNTIAGQVRNRWNSARVKWPYYNMQDKCAWRFGSVGCGFDTSSITLNFDQTDIEVGSTTPLAILFTGTTISQSYSNKRFNFGRLTVTDGPNSGHIRTIRAHSGDLFELSHALPVNSFSTFGFSVFPGCRKRRIADCRSLYDNDENFLGLPWIPIQEDGF